MAYPSSLATIRRTSFCTSILVALGAASVTTRALSQQPDPLPSPGALKRLSLEQLMAIEVSSVSRRPGLGMDEATRNRCLEPFFTTKGERGTGLGLAMVYGTTQRQVAAAPQSRVEYAVPAPLRIRVVDDDPLLLKSLRDALEIAGHTVVAAAGGQAGIDAFRHGLNGGPRSRW
jgi:hypothetical protein